MLNLAFLFNHAEPVERPAWPPRNPKVVYLESIKGKLSPDSQKIWDFLGKPISLFIDQRNEIFFTSSNHVIRIKKTGDISYLGKGILRSPTGIALSSDGRVFVVDSEESAVFVFTGNGSVVHKIHEPERLKRPVGIAIDEKRGIFYLVDTWAHDIKVYSLKNYNFIKIIGSRGTSKGQFNFPTFIALDREGNIYVSDTGNFRIQILSRDGNPLKVIGGLGYRPGSFFRPKGIALDSEGHIYVVDAAFQNIQVFDKDGQLLLVLSEGGAGDGRLGLPCGIFIDRDDRVYVVNQIPSDIKVFQYLGRRK